MLIRNEEKENVQSYNDWSESFLKKLMFNVTF